jgi:hypothetical protein
MKYGIQKPDRKKKSGYDDKKKFWVVLTFRQNPNIKYEILMETKTKCK